MAEQMNMQRENCEVQVEVVETSYVCGECFQVFSTMEDFNDHYCAVDNQVFINQEGSQTQEQILHQESVAGEAQTETEADMEAAVASILVEKMKQNAPQNKATAEVCLEERQWEAGPEQYIESSVEHTSIVDYQTEPDPLLHIVEHTDQLEPGMVVESMEIPSTNVYIYDNPFYLNRLMKDNTCGRRARHDAPYTHRLGPWDDTSSRLLIQLLKEYPKAFFIMGKNSKRTEAWEMIRYKLSEAGYQFTVLQIRMRWRELCKRYRNVVNHNDLHQSKRTCQFFDELNDLFGIWDNKATEILIKELGANGTKRLGQNGGTRMRHKAWQHISDVLADNSYEYTANQVHGRWNALVMLYRRMTNYNMNPNNEPITIAFKDSIETVFSYIPDNKITEKINEKKKWTLSLERSLLNTYKNIVDCFSKKQLKDNKLWQQIVVHLKDESNYITTAEKVKTRFYELTKQYAAMLQHNSEPGTLYRESRHHEILAEIYDQYNCWPHDGSVIKLDKSNAIRLRQLDAQLLWSEEESNAVLQLYPDVLLGHIRNNDQPQPPEELWVQLAKALYAGNAFVKAPYEIEEHVALLRRGHKSPNLFPFREAMDLLEETENSLCFSPESPSRDNDQLLPYWSHKAARLLLDLMIHYRQEGIKMMTDNLFEVICNDMEKKGFRYTAEECREYYFLLQKIYKNRMYSKKKQTENQKPFPYMERMTELRMISSQTGFNKSDEVCSAILKATASQLTNIKEEDKNRRQSLEIMLLNCKVFIRDVTQIRPPPSIKQLAGLLMAAVNDDIAHIDTNEMKQLTDVLRPHMDVLSLISDHGALHIYHDYQAEALKSREKSFERRNMKAIGVQWTNDNTQIMLETIKEWLLLCHDNQEKEDVLGCGQPLWEEVAYKLSRRFNKCPQICWQYFIQLRKEYMVAVTSNDSLKQMPSLKSAHCQDLLQFILTLNVSHDAEWDERDARWMSETTGWSCEESLELLFTIREFWPHNEPTNWEMISLMMCARGFDRNAKTCYMQFKELHSGYQAAYKINQESNFRDRQKPPFYFKIHSLFGFSEDIPSYYVEDIECDPVDPDIDEEELIEVLLAGMKEIKSLLCHSVPRVPLLQALAQYVDFHSQCTWPALNLPQIWKYLVQVHQAQRESVQQGVEGPLGMDLDGLWQDHPNPNVAFGLHCVSYPNWEMVSDWSLEEISILVDTIVRWEGTSDSSQVDGSLGDDSAQQLLSQGHKKSPTQCKDMWQYIVTTFSHGGYQSYKSQINLVYLFQPCMILSAVCEITKLLSQAQHSVEDSHGKGFNFSEQTICRAEENIKCSAPKGVRENNATYSLDNFFKHKMNSENMEETRKMEFLTNIDESLTPNTEFPSQANRNHLESEDINSVKSISDTRTVSNEICENSHVSSLEESKDTKLYTNSDLVNKSDSCKDSKIRAKVISVSESAKAKIVACEVEHLETVEILKLHYPLCYSIPSNIKYLYIPRSLVSLKYKRNNTELQTKSSGDSKALSGTETECEKVQSISKKRKFVFEGRIRKNSPEKNKNSCKKIMKSKNEKEGTQNITHSNTQEDSQNNCENMKRTNDQEAEHISQLALEYLQQCRQEDDQLNSVMRENHEELMTAYQKVMSVVHEMSDLL